MRLIKFIRQSIKQNSSKNILTGFAYQIISVTLGLFLPFLLITELGSETNGLMNSVGQVFICLGLLEGGISQATIQALYKPLSTSSRDDINGILAAADYYYKRTGVLYACAVAGLTVVYPFLIDTEIDSSVIRWVILLQGSSSVISYSVQAKYDCLLSAEGKTYVTRLFSMLAAILRNVGKIVAIMLGYGIVMVQAIHSLMVLLEALYIWIYIRKKYRWVNLKRKPNLSAVSGKNYAFVNSISWMVFNHTDILVLTLFSRNLALISVYSVYLLLFEAGYNFLEMIFQSYQYKLGIQYQTGVTCLDDYFSKYCCVLIPMIFMVFSVLYLIAPAFVGLYTQGITDADYTLFGVAELFFACKSLYAIRMLNRQIIEVNGAFKETSNIAVTETIINVGLSVILAVSLDIIGVLIGSVVSLLIADYAYIKYIRKAGLLHSNTAEKRLLMTCGIVTVITFIIGMNRHICVDNWQRLIFLGVGIGIASCAVFCMIIYLALKYHKKT